MQVTVSLEMEDKECLYAGGLSELVSLINAGKVRVRVQDYFL